MRFDPVPLGPAWAGRRPIHMRTTRVVKLHFSADYVASSTPTLCDLAGTTWLLSDKSASTDHASLRQNAHKTLTKRPHEGALFASPATWIKFRENFRPLGEQIVRLLSANCGRTRHDPSVPVRGHACGWDRAVLRLYSVTTFLDELGIDCRANAEFSVKPNGSPWLG